MIMINPRIKSIESILFIGPLILTDETDLIESQIAGTYIKVRFRKRWSDMAKFDCTEF